MGGGNTEDRGSQRAIQVNPPDFSIVIMSKYRKVLEPLLVSISRFERQHPKIIVVTNGDEITDDLPVKVSRVIRTTDPFVFAKSSNIGIEAAGTDDIVLCNDDVRIVRDQTFYRLRTWAHTVEPLGVLSPLIDGWVGNLYQNAYEVSRRWPKDNGGKPAVIGMYGKSQVCFICVYIKRACLNATGPLDENYTGYGFDDNDYCMAARKCGFLTGITRHVVVKHGEGGAANNRGVNWSVTYSKAEISQEDVKRNYNYFIQKWGINENDFPLVAA